MTLDAPQPAPLVPDPPDQRAELRRLGETLDALADIGASPDIYSH